MPKIVNPLEVTLLNVGRGLSVVIKTPLAQCILFDLGSTVELSPMQYMQKHGIFNTYELYREEGFSGKKIAQCIISHPHLDHISDLNIDNTTFLANNSFYITCQNDKDTNKYGHSIDFSRINNPDGSSDEIENYQSLYKERNLPLSTLIHTEEELYSLKIGYYYITHKQAAELFPEDDQGYTNSLSLVLYILFGDQSILIPGDITPEAFELIYSGRCEKRFTDYSIKQGEQKKNDWAKKTCDQPILKTLLAKKLTFFVAPHHGLESGYPQFLFDALGDNKPELIIISDKLHDSDNSGSTHVNYQNGTASIGRKHKGKDRYSISTIKDGHIKITLNEKDSFTESSSKIEEVLS